MGGSAYCTNYGTNGKLCDAGSGYTYDCQFGTDRYTCAPGDISAKVGMLENSASYALDKTHFGDNSLTPKTDDLVGKVMAIYCDGNDDKKILACAPIGSVPTSAPTNMPTGSPITAAPTNVPTGTPVTTTAAPSEAPYTPGTPSAAPTTTTAEPSEAPYTPGTPSAAPTTTTAEPSEAPYTPGTPSAAPTTPTTTTVATPTADDGGAAQYAIVGSLLMSFVAFAALM